MDIKTGARLRSAVCTTELIVVRAPGGEVDVRCGGQPMLPADAPPAELLPLDPEHASGTQLGKRLGDEELGLEFLCTKAGEGSISIGDTPLGVKVTKPLPSSD